MWAGRMSVLREGGEFSCWGSGLGLAILREGWSFGRAGVRVDVEFLALIAGLLIIEG